MLQSKEEFEPGANERQYDANYRYRSDNLDLSFSYDPYTREPYPVAEQV